MNYYLNVWKKFAVFSGRASRSEYWYFILFNIIISIILAQVSQLFEISFIAPIYQLLIFLPTLAVSVRRMHDVGKSGWYILIPIYSFVLAVQAGQKGTNSFGEDPSL
jgi:uncharacterized membrane protein YhaH (DUF805 family)